LNAKNIEVEFRACLDDKKYEELIEFFSKNGNFVLDGERITIGYGPQDLRIRKDWNGTVLMLKRGDMKDYKRKEHVTKIDDIEEMQRIIESLGFYHLHNWKTIRKKFDYQGFSVAIDHIPEFMKTIEIERMCSEEEAEECKKEIQKIFSDLGLVSLDYDWFKAEIDKYGKRFHKGEIKV